MIASVGRRCGWTRGTVVPRLPVVLLARSTSKRIRARKFAFTDAALQVALRHAEAAQVLLRQVDAVALGIFLHVAQDVGQLEAPARSLRIFASPAPAASKPQTWMQTNPTTLATR